MMRLNVDFLISLGLRFFLVFVKFCKVKKNVEKFINCFNFVLNICIIVYGIFYNKKLCFLRIFYYIFINLAKYFIKLRVFYVD